MLFFDENRTCAYCGAITNAPYMASGHSRGTSDLDFRPARPLGNYIGGWVDSCPQCGYVASDISTPIEDMERCKSIINSDRYRTVDGFPFFGSGSKMFYRLSLMEEEYDHEYEATLSLLHGAWYNETLDYDIKNKANYIADAELFRRLTIKKIEEYSKTLQKDRERYEELLLILIDCYRRVSEFSAVIYLCNTEKCVTKKEYSSALLFQRDLALAGDNRCYDFASAYEAYPVDAGKESSSATAIVDRAKSNGKAPYEYLKSIFEHENEPDFTPKLQDYLRHLPYSRRSAHAVEDMFHDHPYCGELLTQICIFNDLFTDAEQEQFFELFRYCRRDR